MTPKRDEMLTFEELFEQQTASYYSPREWKNMKNQKANKKPCFTGESAMWC